MGRLSVGWITWQHPCAKKFRLGPSVRLVAAFTCVVMLMPLPVPAFAQAGSTGGTLGKTDKSVSGGDEAERSKTSSARPGIGHREAVRASACSKLIGVWKGALGGDIIFKSDGAVLSTSPVNEGTWSCDNTEITITWKINGGVDHCALSSDGMRQRCLNNLGYAFTRTRKSKKGPT